MRGRGSGQGGNLVDALYVILDISCDNRTPTEETSCLEDVEGRGRGRGGRWRDWVVPTPAKPAVYRRRSSGARRFAMLLVSGPYRRFPSPRSRGARGGEGRKSSPPFWNSTLRLRRFFPASKLSYRPRDHYPKKKWTREIQVGEGRVCNYEISVPGMNEACMKREGCELPKTTIPAQVAESKWFRGES